MAANFPAATPAFTNPSGTDYLNSPAHATLHSSVNDEVVAIAAKVGMTSSTVTTSHDYKLTPRIITDTDGATVTFDLSLRGIHTVTLGGNRTLAISNATVGQTFILRLSQDATGSRTVTWFSTIKWAGGSAPTLTTTASKADTFGFIVTSAGNYDGYIIGLNV
jgi:hypothetical protein